jgi:outer membrane biosynthesis protein TonB
MKRLFICAFALAFLCSAGFAQKAKTAETPTTAEPKTTVGPDISFEKTVHDYGTIEKGANGDCEFAFTNVGDEPLILSDVKASCGCTTPSWPREPIAPGEKGTIKVHYDTQRMGSINKSVTVTSNGKTDRVVLRITGNITAPPPPPAEPVN